MFRDELLPLKECIRVEKRPKICNVRFKFKHAEKYQIKFKKEEKYKNTNIQINENYYRNKKHFSLYIYGNSKDDFKFPKK